MHELVLDEANARLRTLKAQLTLVDSELEEWRNEHSRLYTKKSKIKALIDGYAALIAEGTQPGATIEVTTAHYAVDN